MSVIYRIPKFSDREIVLRLSRVRQASAFKGKHKFKMLVNIPHRGNIELPEQGPLDVEEYKFVFDAESQVIGSFQLNSQNGHAAFRVHRKPSEPTDTAEIADDWSNNADDRLRQELPFLYTSLLALSRMELQAPELEAAFSGSNDNAWNGYRQAQMAVVNSLQQATESLIIQASQKNAELDKARSERFEKLEADLRAQLDRERRELQATNDQKLDGLRKQEKVLADKEASFNTKESHYVARQKQTEQIEKIQSWLDNWSLTKGTSRKRWPIALAYIVGMLFAGGLTVYATWHSYDVLKSADEIVKLAWWQWAAIWAKSFFPLLAFATFIIYFIRWSGDWARQHSEEEFRNRTRLVDIGRSSWLLEAVRDAQERNKEIPPDLLRELSRNLFSASAGMEKDLHPQAVSDLLLQGLSSVRVKAADGSEVEAKRDNKK